ncbi:MAG: hypothetical protein WC726_04130 [Parcubacteria group bacterium]|jgi:hypothetical protein
MAQSNYQEPIEQKDLDLAKKIKEAVNIDSEKIVAEDVERKEIIPTPEISGEAQSETKAESPEEKISEKIETARQTIGAQQATPVANVANDAQTVSEIQEFEKKVEKLVEIAGKYGPEHAIRVAQHMDKGKDSTQTDNYTLDEIHDRLMEDELRNQLMQKGLLKEL